MREEARDLGEREDEHQVEEELEGRDPLFPLDRPIAHAWVRRYARGTSSERGGSGIGREQALDGTPRVPSVLLAVSVVDAPLEIGIALDEGHVLLDVAGADPTLAANLGVAVPAARRSADRPHEQVVPDADHPDRRPSAGGTLSEEG